MEEKCGRIQAVMKRHRFGFGCKSIFWEIDWIVYNVGLRPFWEHLNAWKSMRIFCVWRRRVWFFWQYVYNVSILPFCCVSP